jgi:hypothetical protein
MPDLPWWGWMIVALVVIVLAALAHDPDDHYPRNGEM